MADNQTWKQGQAQFNRICTNKEYLTITQKEQQITQSQYYKAFHHALSTNQLTQLKHQQRLFFIQPLIESNSLGPNKLVQHITQSICSLFQAMDDRDQLLVQEQVKELQEMMGRVQNELKQSKIRETKDKYQTLISYEMRGRYEDKIQVEEIKTKSLLLVKEIKKNYMERGGQSRDSSQKHKHKNNKAQEQTNPNIKQPQNKNKCNRMSISNELSKLMRKRELTLLQRKQKQVRTNFNNNLFLCKQ